MNAKVDVLSVLDRLIGNARTTAGLTGDPRMRDNLRDGEQARAAVDELIETLEVAQGDLHMLKKAIEARDPWPELLVRATDTERDLRVALANIGDTK